MALPMNTELRSLAEAYATDRTAEWFFPSVHKAMLHQTLFACKVAGTQVTSEVFDIQMSGVDVSAQVKLAGKCFGAVFVVAGKAFLKVTLHNICMVESKPLVSMEAPYNIGPLAERKGKT
jgi:hypothetical protein